MNTERIQLDNLENPFIMDSEENTDALQVDNQLQKQIPAKVVPKHMKNMLRNTDLVDRLNICPNKKDLIREFVKVAENLKSVQRKMVQSLKRKCSLFAVSEEFDSDEEGPVYQPELDESQVDTSDNLTVEDKLQFETTSKLMDYVENEVVQRLFDQFGEITCNDHRCKLCGELFQTGRQLGGHMSRKHPGMSESYNTKKIIHKYKKGERARKEYLKALSGIETTNKPKEKAPRKPKVTKILKVEPPKPSVMPIIFEKREDDYPILDFNREMFKESPNEIFFQKEQPVHQYQPYEFNQMEQEIIFSYD